MSNSKSFFKIISLVLIIATLSQFATDVYLPSLPAITHSFATSTTLVQFTITIYLIGHGIANLIYGPLSDRYGRKKILIFGMLIGIGGSILCSLAESVNALILGRFIQGLGFSANIVAGRAIMRDSFQGTELAKANSYLATLFSWVLASAPILGGYLQAYFNWRASFYFLLFYALLIFALVIYRLPETNLFQNHSSQQHSSLFSTFTKSYLILLSHRTFLGYALISSFTYSGIIAFVTLSPYLYQTLLGLSPIENGWLAVFNTATFSVGALINSRLVMSLGTDRMIEIGIGLKIISGLFLIVFTILDHLQVYQLVLCMSLFCMGAGSIFANSSSSAINPFAERAGSAGALLNFLQIIVASIVSGLIASSHQISLLPIGISVLILAACSFLALKFLAQKNKYFYHAERSEGSL